MLPPPPTVDQSPLAMLPPPPAHGRLHAAGFVFEAPGHSRLLAAGGVATAATHSGKSPIFSRACVIVCLIVPATTYRAEVICNAVARQNIVKVA